MTERERERPGPAPAGGAAARRGGQRQCRCHLPLYGISRNCSCKWLRRYEAEGTEGLKDRSSKPHYSPRAAQAEVAEKIIWLGQHYPFGPEKIAMYLQRYRDVQVSKSGCGGSCSGWA